MIDLDEELKEILLQLINNEIEDAIIKKQQLDAKYNLSISELWEIEDLTERIQKLEKIKEKL